MKILQKKICVLGDFGVGKTSLVGRFVKNEFSDKYLTTVGVKMDTKLMKVNDDLQIKLILWDIAGENSFKRLSKMYLRGAAGFLLVLDGTRLSTLEAALDIKQNILTQQGDIPFVVLVNKIDLKDQWEIKEDDLRRLKVESNQLFLTSAKNGDQVEDAFYLLSQLLAS
ncbi:MAG: GTP-binding protein [Methylococcales bacterium]|nr:GTP-binding protein [Methylococcales bacterium]MCK5926097.1 GTP-binding protein [Methylococcales bacterium]